MPSKNILQSFLRNSCVYVKRGGGSRGSHIERKRIAINCEPKIKLLRPHFKSQAGIGSVN